MRIEKSIINGITVNTIIYEPEDHRSNTEKQEILDICSTCEKFNSDCCSECGCIIESLIHLKVNNCPLNKW